MEGLLTFGGPMTPFEVDRQVRHRLAMTRRAEEVSGKVAPMGRTLAVGLRQLLGVSLDHIGANSSTRSR